MKNFKIELDNGNVLTVAEAGDCDYPGVELKVFDKSGEEKARIIVEQDKNESEKNLLNCYLWEDKDSDEFTKKVSIKL